VPSLDLPGGGNFATLANSLGYAFAASAYSKNGYAVREGVIDTKALVDYVKGLLDYLRASNPQIPLLRRVYVIGASEGGLVTVALLELFPEVFAGGLSACGAVGGWAPMMQYVADYRVVLDYFFAQEVTSPPPDHPEFFLGANALVVPEALSRSWEDAANPGGISAAQAYYLSAFEASPAKTAELLRTALVPVDPSNPATMLFSAMQALHFAVLGTEDVRMTAGGNPADNRSRWYFGSSNDWLLNQSVQRIQADASAAAFVQANYSPTGNLQRPLVSIHNVFDPAVPFRNELTYAFRVASQGRSENLLTIPILAPSYGHCNLTPEQLLLSFAALVYKVEGSLPAKVSEAQVAKAPWLKSFKNEKLHHQVPTSERVR
jgi:pimeloyl-ACP methyl ester carboxylesterase